MSVSIRPMLPADRSFGERLVRQSNWNQTPADWENLLSAPEIDVFVAENAQGPAGTVSVVHFGDELSWIGMLLVDRAFRRQGIGMLLLDQALAVCRERGSACVGLDATPAGRPLYEKKGFEPSATLERWSGSAPVSSSHLPKICERDWEEIAAFDWARFGANRLFWLRRLAPMGPTALLRRKGAVAGFGMARPGAQAWYLGPIVAHSESAAVEVAENLLAALHPGKVVWDCFTGLPRRFGMEPERPLYRMLTQRSVPPGPGAGIFAIADPAIG